MKLTLLHGWFSRFLNCINGSKPRNASHVRKYGSLKACILAYFIQFVRFYFSVFCTWLLVTFVESSKWGKIVKTSINGNVTDDNLKNKSVYGPRPGNFVFPKCDCWYSNIFFPYLSSYSLMLNMISTPFVSVLSFFFFYSDYAACIIFFPLLQI